MWELCETLRAPSRTSLRDAQSVHGPYPLPAVCSQAAQRLGQITIVSLRISDKVLVKKERKNLYVIQASFRPWEFHFQQV